MAPPPRDVATLPTGLDRLGGRNGEIWRAYASGRTQEWIAKRHGIDQSRVSQIIATVRATLPDDAREDWRTVALETLLHLHAEMVELANGEPTKIYNDDGVLIEVDHGNRLAAADRVIKLQDRAARMLGTDAPEKVEARPSRRSRRRTLHGPSWCGEA